MLPLFSQPQTCTCTRALGNMGAVISGNPHTGGTLTFAFRMAPHRVQVNQNLFPPCPSPCPGTPPPASHAQGPSRTWRPEVMVTLWQASDG